MEKEIQTIYMGFNSNEGNSIALLKQAVEKFGIAKAFYGVTGRTLHQILCYELSTILNQYAFDIEGYNCIVRKKTV